MENVRSCFICFVFLTRFRDSFMSTSNFFFCHWSENVCPLQVHFRSFYEVKDSIANRPEDNSRFKSLTSCWSNESDNLTAL